MTVQYTAEARVTGGRAGGHGRSSDGELDVDLRLPKELGGAGGATHPEQLFAVGYAACFETVLTSVAGRRGLDVADTVIARIQGMSGYPGLDSHSFPESGPSWLSW